MKTDGTTRVYICGVGGQGSVTAGRLLGEAALAAGLPVTVSEVHGMSQRGGIVEGAVLIGGAISPLVGKGDADVLLAFEPLEALRALEYCSAKTTVIVNTRPIVPFSVSLGQGKYPELSEILSQLSALVKRVIAFDATELAERAGHAQAINAVLLGALAGSGVTPIDEETLRRIVTESVGKKFQETNAKAYALGCRALAGEAE